MDDLQGIKIDPEKLKAARGERGLTAVASIIGISKQQLWNYENGLYEPSSSTLAKLCLLYQVSIESLVNIDRKNLKKMYIAA